MNDLFGTAQGLPCPCGSGSSYSDCCAPIIDRKREAETAEELMRSRYTAYVTGADDHLFRTWHPRSRPADISVAGPVWTGLRIIDVVAGGSDDDEGVVEFEASYVGGALHERSRFQRRGDRWVYLDGEVRTP